LKVQMKLDWTQLEDVCIKWSDCLDILFLWSSFL
jgi:hypothetical protein